MRKIALGIGTLALVLGVMAVSTGTAFAYKGDPAVQGPNYSQERHTAMLNALQNKDFDAWSSLMQGKGRVTQVINKDNFAKFVEAHDLALQGKIEEAQKIRQDLGLGQRGGQGHGRGMGMGMGRGLAR